MKRGSGAKRRDHRAAISDSTAVAAAIVVLLVGVSVFYLATLNGVGRSTTSSISQSTMRGIIAGTVTVGPSQPVCSPDQPCTEDIAGYSLVFRSQCGTTRAPSSSVSCQSQDFTAQIAPNGHYSILLAPGNYTITGLSPSCNWMGCSSSFPKAVVVEGGQQLIVNIDVDTGIR